MTRPWSSSGRGDDGDQETLLIVVLDHLEAQHADDVLSGRGWRRIEEWAPGPNGSIAQVVQSPLPPAL